MGESSGCTAGGTQISAVREDDLIPLTINQLVDIAEDIAQVKLKRRYDLTAPQGVRGRNSDNTFIRRRLGWEPSIPLRYGMEKTYAWISEEILQGIPSLTH